VEVVVVPSAGFLVEAPLEVVERFLAVSFASSRILFASHCATRQVPLVARLYFNVAFTNLRWKPLESTADTSSSSPPLGARAEMRSTSEATFMRLCTLGYEFSCARFVRWTLRYESAVTCCPGTRRFSTALFYAGFHWPVLGFPGWPLVWCERARLVLARLASASARVEESFWPSASVHAAGCGDSLAPTGERRRGDLGRYPARLTSLEPLR
jgi:hypothetical protein